MKYLIAVSFALTIVAAETFDYVIVGAGTAGLVIANRLSADPSVTVRVIDPGDDQRLNPNVSIPDNLGNPPGTDLDWKYKTVPQVNSGDRILDAPQGKAWGGSSAINGMTYLRGDAAVFDAWESLGNKGWNWESMLPYFKKSEKFTPPNDEQLSAGATYVENPHGYKGNIHVGYENTFVTNNFAPAATETWKKLGYSQCPDFNAGQVLGYSVAPQTRDSEKPLRWDSVVSYYSPVEHRKNLKIIKGTVKRITWKPRSRGGSCKLVRANGVEYLDENGRLQSVSVGREVIVSAGTLRSPLVLEGSGVGNPSILKKLSIETVVDLPGVGENLIEQPGGVAGTLSNTGGAAMAFIAMASAKDIFGDGLDAYRERVMEAIPEVARSIVDATPGGALSVKALETQIRIQHDLLFNKDVAFAEIQTVSPPNLPATFTQFWILFPFARGSLHLGHSDELNTPLFDPRFFLTDLDLEGLAASGKVTQTFYSTSPMADIRLGPLPPPYDGLPDNATDAEMRAYLRNTAMVMNHQVGSMAMMSRDLGGVVDADLKVYGTANVRVVDASVMPTQISGHLTAVIYAIAEKAADVIKASQKQE